MPNDDAGRIADTVYAAVAGYIARELAPLTVRIDEQRALIDALTARVRALEAERAALPPSPEREQRELDWQ
jgi:hypothetical protein